jgi:hypothetical protein
MKAAAEDLMALTIVVVGVVQLSAFTTVTL